MNTKDLNIETILSNMEFMLRNMRREEMRENPRVRHYVGLNYRLHLSRLQEDGYDATATDYLKKWEDVVRHPLGDVQP